MQLGAMQDWPLRLMRLVDHAEREHPNGEIVHAGPTAGSPAPITGTSRAMPAERRGRSSGSGISGDRVATLAMNHEHHLLAWYGAVGMGAILHTLNPRLFEDQLDFIANHAQDRVLFTIRLSRVVDAEAALDDHRALYLLGPADGEGASRSGSRPRTAITNGSTATSATRAVELHQRHHRQPKGVIYEHRSTMLHTLGFVSPRRVRRLGTEPWSCRSSRCSTPTPGACPGRRPMAAPSWSCRPTTRPMRCAT